MEHPVYMVCTRLSRMEEKSFQKMAGVALEKVSSGHEATHKGPRDPIDANILTMHRPSTPGWRGRV